MAPNREDFVTPVGFATEPARERRRWIGRIFLALVLIALGYLLINRVFKAPDDGPSPTSFESTLPSG